MTVRTKEELQDALEYFAAAVEASQEAGQGGETSATEATSMLDDGADHAASASRPGGTHWVPQGEDAGQEAMQVDDGAPLEGMLAPGEINEALNALHLRNVPLIEVDTDNEAECIEPDIEAEPLLEEADRISVAPEFHECLPATDKDAARLGFVSAFAPEPENGPVGRGLQDDAEIEEDLDPAVLESLDEAVAALALVADMAAAKEVLSLPTSYPWGDVLFSTDPATKAGLHAARNTLALRRLSPDAPALGSEEKLRFLRSWLLCLATALASVFERLGREDAHPRVRQLMLDRLAQPQFWNAALTIATRQHAQLLQMRDTLEELETGTESLATGEQVAQWFGRSSPGDWPLHRLKVHIPVAAMASKGGVALKGTIQASRACGLSWQAD